MEHDLKYTETQVSGELNLNFELTDVNQFVVDWHQKVRGLAQIRRSKSLAKMVEEKGDVLRLVKRSFN